ncbi:hypothetical protein DFQ29_002904, partial [Apophysomyces sp. BC1021]
RPPKRHQQSLSSQRLLSFSSAATGTELRTDNASSTSRNIQHPVEINVQCQSTMNDTHDLGGLMSITEQATSSSQNQADQNNGHSIEENIFTDNLIEESAIEDEPFEDDENVFDNETGYREAQDGVLEKYFLSIQRRLSQETYPKEYSLGTFWINLQSPFFALRDNILDPDILCYPRVFL